MTDILDIFTLKKEKIELFSFSFLGWGLRVEFRHLN